MSGGPSLPAVSLVPQAEANLIRIVSFGELAREAATVANGVAEAYVNVARRRQAKCVRSQGLMRRKNCVPTGWVTVVAQLVDVTTTATGQFDQLPDARSLLVWST